MNKEINVTDKYVCFWGSEFSNFYPCKIVAENRKFKTSEQYFMWQKADYFCDDVIAEAILNSSTPMEAKALGRRVDGFVEEAWEKVREQAMFNAVYCKFSQNEDLKRVLLSEEFKDKHFVEGSPTDRIWGVGIIWNDEKIADENNWNGLNLLGKTLDAVRERLLSE